MPPLIDLTGQRFGLLVVEGRAGSSRHGGSTWLCRCDCGGEKTVQSGCLRGGGTRSCGCLLRGKNHPNWRGGRFGDGQGYIRVYAPDHPNSNDEGRLLEHTLVMSEYLGRPLRKGETVHHKNGVRDDNRIDNLELWSSHHPPGQRVSDKVAWAKEILSTYEPGALAWSDPEWTPDPLFMRGSVWVRPFETTWGAS